mmetsp:Transcript_23623/g.41909  ORF Transcript_23623/g.41909 Transcript_23623/m.41909 type:complete len:244 (+) Transcript_23623:4247-4978(+)
MHIDADHIEVFHRTRHGIDFAGAGDRNTEFVFGFTGGDFGMGLGVDIGVHADRDGGNCAHFARNPVQHFHLRFGFNVELTDAARQGQTDLVSGLADPGKNDLVARHTRRPGACIFAARHHIHAGTSLSKGPEDRDIARRFHRIADQVVHACQRLVQHCEMPQQCRRRIDVERCAHGCRDLRDGDVLGVQSAVFVNEMIHAARRLSGCATQINWTFPVARLPLFLGHRLHARHGLFLSCHNPGP